MANEKWSGSNPWLGLAPYTEGTPLYGRTHESAVLSEIIKVNIATIVYGKSGIGKSSLLSAGISPMLRNEHYIPVPLRLVHNTDVSYVEQIESRVRELVECKDELSENVPDLGLWDFFHRHTFTKDGIVCQPVIILDQFEEIYTLTDVEHKPDIITLFTELASLLNDIKPDAVLAAESSFSGGTTASASSGDDFSFELSTESSFAYNETVSFRFVICLREDKLYLLERNSANIPSIKTNRYNLQALSPDSALEVIMCPRPDLFTKEEATAIVDKLADMGDEGIRTVDPAILSLFLYKYFEKKGEANYDNIFADYYHEATKGIKDKSLAFLEDHLLTLGGYRNQIPVDDALSSGVTQTEINSLLKQIILRSEKRKGIDYIEFSHDRLCAEAKKSREERQQKGKIIIIVKYCVIAVILFLIIVGGVLFFRTIKLNIELLQSNKDKQEAYNKLSVNANLLSLSNDSLFKLGEKNDFLIDSLSKQTSLINEQNNTLNNRIGQINTLNLLLQLQKDSLKIERDYQKTRANELELLNDSLRRLNSNLAQQKATIVAQDKENGTIKAYMTCISLREAFGSLNKAGLSNSLKELNAIGAVDFGSLRLIDGEAADLKGHLVFSSDFVKHLINGDEESYVYRTAQRGQIMSGTILTKTCCVKKRSFLKYRFSARGNEEIAFVTEPGGLISVKLFDSTNKAILYDSTSDNKGAPFHMYIATLPNDRRTNIEIEIINRTDNDISFVVISN